MLSFLALASACLSCVHWWKVRPLFPLMPPQHTPPRAGLAVYHELIRCICVAYSVNICLLIFCERLARGSHMAVKSQSNAFAGGNEAKQLGFDDVLG